MAKKAAQATKPAKKSVAKPAKAAAAKASKPAAKPAKAKSAAPAKKAQKAAPVKPVKAASPKKAAAAKPAPVAKKAVEKEAPKAKLKLVEVPVEDVTSTIEEAPSAPVKAPKKKAEAAPAAKPAVEGGTKSVKATLKLLKSDKGGGDDAAHWQDLHDKFKAEKAQAYDMKEVFEAGKPLQHKVLGWGWIISNENDRLEVLFKDGRRTLISNYNPNR